MSADTVLNWAFSSLLLSLRVSPVFALAPPFAFVQVPSLFRVLFGVGISACLLWSQPIPPHLDLSSYGLVATAIRELLLGSIFVMMFHLAFAAIYVAGRTIDIQAGFGFAVLIDPATSNQTPMVGTFFAYAAAAIFFAMNGHVELLRIFGASLRAIPLGQGTMPHALAPLTSFLSIMFLTSFGVAGGVMLSMFVADLAIAMLSRTVPQMNVLVLGFQVKTLLLLVVMPTTFGIAGVLLARMMRLTLEAIPGML